MIDRLTALCLAGSALIAVTLPFEFRSDLPGTVESEKPSPKCIPVKRMSLSGVADITPDQRTAIFAPAGGKPVVRSEGEMISDWRIESIGSQSVSLTGPTGTATLEPKADPNLVRVTAGQQTAGQQRAPQQAMAPPPQPAAPAAKPQPMPAPNTVRAPTPVRRSSR